MTGLTVALSVFLAAAAAYAAAPAARAAAGQGQRAAAPPPATLASPAIPGVVAAGTRVELVSGDLRRTEGPVAMPDGDDYVAIGAYVSSLK